MHKSIDYNPKPNYNLTIGIIWHHKGENICFAKNADTK